MPRNVKQRPGWSEERRAKVAETWRLRKEQQHALDEVSKINTKRQGRICVYCGEKYDIREHVPILRARITLPVSGPKIKFVIVPACKECHRHLEYDESLTVTQRRAIIKNILRDKYTAFLDWKEYTPNNYELRQTLSRHHLELLDGMNRAKTIILRRLKYKEGE